ncbi:MAG: sugar phosphate nucleotidyltransferase [Candidatus Thorarchaeota archaeon]
MAAGKGERLEGLTQTVPKALVQVAGKTLLEHSIERFTKAGIQKIIIAVGWKSDMIIDAIALLENLPEVQIVDVPNYEIGPLQTLTTALLSFDNQKSIICPVDLLISSEAITELVSCHADNQGAKVTLAIDSDATSGSSVSVTSSGQVIGIQKEVDNAASIAKSAMFMVVSSDFVKHCENALNNGATTAVSVLNDLIDKDHPVQSYYIHEKWFDVDTLADVLEANNSYLESASVEYHKSIFVPSGDTMEIGDTLHLDSGIEVGKGVCLKGPCLIQKDSTIGQNCIIGPYTVLGAKTHVGNQCEIQNTVIFRQSKIPNHSKLNNIIMSESEIFRMEE